jgi:hypothetical protein
MAWFLEQYRLGQSMEVWALICGFERAALQVYCKSSAGIVAEVGVWAGKEMTNTVSDVFGYVFGKLSKSA